VRSSEQAVDAEAAASAPEAEPPLSLPAAVLALLVGLDHDRLAAVARGLGLTGAGSRADVAMRIAGRAVADPDDLSRLLGLLEHGELRLACREVLGLPSHGGRAALIGRVCAWLAAFLPADPR
jgi:hypothetical protein